MFRVTTNGFGFQEVLVMCFANQEFRGKQVMEHPKVVEISRDPHWSDYAELGVLRDKFLAAERKRSRRRDYLTLVVAILCVLVIIAICTVAGRWNVH